MEIRRTQEFDKRLKKLADTKAKARIAITVQRMEDGNFGDSKSVGGGVSEARIHYGPGYRVYYTRRGREIVVLSYAVTRPAKRRTSFTPRKWPVTFEDVSPIEGQPNHDYQDFKI